MIEKVVERNGKKVTEVRSKAGKLLFVKTSQGYEIKCPRTKEICLVKYEEMLNDCMMCLNDKKEINKIKNRGPAILNPEPIVLGKKGVRNEAS